MVISALLWPCCLISTSHPSRDPELPWQRMCSPGTPRNCRTPSGSQATMVPALPAPGPASYLEEEDEDDTEAAGSFQHRLGPCLLQSPLPWGWGSLSLRQGGCGTRGMSGPSPPLPAAGSLSGTGSFTALAPSLTPCASSRAAPSPASLKRHTPYTRTPGGWGDALTGSAGGPRGQTTPSHSDRHQSRAQSMAVGCSVPTE